MIIKALVTAILMILVVPAFFTKYKIAGFILLLLSGMLKLESHFNRMIKISSLFFGFFQPPVCTFLSLYGHCTRIFKIDNVSLMLVFEKFDIIYAKDRCTHTFYQFIDI